MEDREYDKGLAFGVCGLDRLLELARPATQDPHSCERLYDFARSGVLMLLRCERGQDEIESWKEGLSRISALALGLYEENKSEYLHTTASRFETLADLLGDQRIWKEAYNLPALLKLPFAIETLLFLEDKESTSLEDYLAAMEMKHTSMLSFLAQLRLVSWDEPVKGEISIWLTPEGRLIAADLHSQERLRLGT